MGIPIPGGGCTNQRLGGISHTGVFSATLPHPLAGMGSPIPGATGATTQTTSPVWDFPYRRAPGPLPHPINSMGNPIPGLAGTPATHRDVILHYITPSMTCLCAFRWQRLCYGNIACLCTSATFLGIHAILISVCSARQHHDLDGLREISQSALGSTACGGSY